jgi:hypothetical protein
MGCCWVKNDTTRSQNLLFRSYQFQASRLYYPVSKINTMIHCTRFFSPGPNDGTGAPIKNKELNEEDDFNDDDAIVNSEETLDTDEENADTDNGFDETALPEEDDLENEETADEEADEESSKI